MVEVTVETEQSQKLTFIQLNAPCSPNEELLLAGRFRVQVVSEWLEQSWMTE